MKTLITYLSLLMISGGLIIPRYHDPGINTGVAKVRVAGKDICNIVRNDDDNYSFGKVVKNWLRY